jgi:DUF971 family protein
MSVAVEPKHIAVSKSKGIRVDWSDGESSNYPLQFLRDRCPCATCTGAHGGAPASETQPDPFHMYKPALKIDAVEPVGGYAMKVRWNDGHDTGIYSWDYLRKIRQDAPSQQ